MDLERWDPWDDFFKVQKEVNEIFNSFFEKLSRVHSGTPIAFSPPLDTYETEHEFVIRVSLPGVIQEDVDITVEGAKLILRGVRDKPTDVREGGYALQEWRYGRFERVIPLTFAPAQESIHAVFEGGILEIRLPLAGEGGEE